MAATELTVQSSVITGTTLTANSVNTGDGVSFTNNGRVRILVVNGSGGALTFTAVTSYVIETDLAVADRNYTIADGAAVYIGPFDSTYYGSTVTLNSWSTDTNITIYVLSA